MSVQQIKRNRRLFREAEGFLELATLFDDQHPLEADRKRELADRCLATLAQIQDAGIRKFRVCYLQGQALRLAENYPKAIEALEQAFTLDDSNVHTCFALAWCYKRSGQIEMAVDAMQRAIVLNPESGMVHFNLACYLALQKNTGLALIHLAKAIEIDPQYRELAKHEADFDPIRDDPEFQAKTAAAF